MICNWKQHFDIQRFAAAGTQTTGTSTLSAEMKTYYGMELLENAKPALVHNQFAATKPLPVGGGKTVEWRKFGSFDKALTPLTEGVTPDGSGISVSYITKELAQYGDYIVQSDMLELTAIDNTIVEATRLLGDQAGRTLDTVTREVLAGGTNVLYCPKIATDGTETAVTARASLDATCLLTVKQVFRAAAILKAANAPKINGYYSGIIHPDCSYDLMSDPKWVNVKTYSDPDGIYEGEIGRIEGVRFVETSEAKVFTHAGKDYETGTTSSGTVTPKASARDVYSTLILGADAYGVTEITGGGLQHIVKQLGSAGTADPLDQRATAGWKATKVAERLVEAYMVRIETCSTFNS